MNNRLVATPGQNVQGAVDKIIGAGRSIHPGDRDLTPASTLQNVAQLQRCRVTAHTISEKIVSVPVPCYLRRLPWEISAAYLSTNSV